MQKISIILATWNRGDLLHIPIESCINQTYTNWELLVMDDASTDNTEKIVKSYKDKRIKYFKLPKQDYYTHVRNKGIDESKGDLITFRDSDGGWEETFLEELAKPHRNEDVLVTYCFRIKWDLSQMQLGMIGRVGLQMCDSSLTKVCPLGS